VANEAGEISEALLSKDHDEGNGALDADDKKSLILSFLAIIVSIPALIGA